MTMCSSMCGGRPSPCQHLGAPLFERHVGVGDRTSQCPGERLGHLPHVHRPWSGQLVDVADVPSRIPEHGGGHPRDIADRDGRCTPGSEGQGERSVPLDRLCRERGEERVVEERGGPDMNHRQSRPGQHLLGQPVQPLLVGLVRAGGRHLRHRHLGHADQGLQSPALLGHGRHDGRGQQVIAGHGHREVHPPDAPRPAATVSGRVRSPRTTSAPNRRSSAARSSSRRTMTRTGTSCVRRFSITSRPTPPAPVMSTVSREGIDGPPCSTAGARACFGVRRVPESAASLDAVWPKDVVGTSACFTHEGPSLTTTRSAEPAGPAEPPCGPGGPRFRPGGDRLSGVMRPPGTGYPRAGTRQPTWPWRRAIWRRCLRTSTIRMRRPR